MAWPYILHTVIHTLDPQVSEPRRRELFEVYLSGLREAAAVTESARAAAERALIARIPPSNPAPNLSLPKNSGLSTTVPTAGQHQQPILDSPPSAAAPVDLSRIEVLRKEQARLRFEYERMEAKLMEMEALMRERERVDDGAAGVARARLLKHQQPGGRGGDMAGIGEDEEDTDQLRQIVDVEAEGDAYTSSSATWEGGPSRAEEEGNIVPLRVEIEEGTVVFKFDKELRRKRKGKGAGLAGPQEHLQ